MADQPSKSSSAPSGSDDASPGALRISADDALFGGELRGMVATFYQNERPLGGLAGLLDWRFHGAISFHLRQGAISGREGELVYVPVDREGKTYHVLLVGVGASEATGERAKVPDEILERIKSGVRTLGIERIGISRADLGGPDEESLRRRLKGTSLWIVN